MKNQSKIDKYFESVKYFLKWSKSIREEATKRYLKKHNPNHPLLNKLSTKMKRKRR